MHENHDQPEPSLQALLARMSAVDLVLVEGFKRQPHPKMEIHRPSLGKPLLYPDDPSIVAIACSAGLSTATIPHFDIDDVTGITDFMLATVGLTATEGAA
jgi:molybdopterin-guanine dinucleotide biosynthesis protein MobB